MIGNVHAALQKRDDTFQSVRDLDKGIYELFNLISSVISCLCGVCIALSSRHLYINKIYTKMPLLASFLWLASSLMLRLSLQYDEESMEYYVITLFGVSSDGSVRSLLLWFTYIRTAALWSTGARSLLCFALLVQGFQIFACIYVVLAVLPLATQTKALAVALLAMSDLPTALLDVLLIFRMWQLKLALGRESVNSPFVNTKPLFFHLAAITIFVVICISFAMAALFFTAYDPYWTFNTILFAFRILLTDVFSNLIHRSLIAESVAVMSPPSHSSPRSSPSSLSSPSSPTSPSSPSSPSSPAIVAAKPFSPKRLSLDHDRQPLRPRVSTDTDDPQHSSRELSLSRPLIATVVLLS